MIVTHRVMGLGVQKGIGVSFVFLSFALANAAHAVPPAKRVACVQALEAKKKTRQLIAEYGKLAGPAYWQNFMSNNAEYLRFILRADFEAKKDRLHPTEMYGTKNYLAWKAADDYLNAIPIGQLELSIELFEEVHRLATADLFPALKTLAPVVPDGFLPTKGGVIRKRPSVGKAALFEPIDETAYHELKQNEWLGGFQEVPGLSKPGARRGLIIYSMPWQIRAKLEALIAWYNKHKAKKDPISLATQFQRAFVSIHPLVDGNGRTSRLLMDRILREYGLPGPLLENQENDLYLPYPEYRRQVQEGIEEAIGLLKGERYGGMAPSIAEKTNNSTSAKFKYSERFNSPAAFVATSGNSFNSFKDRILNLGGTPFLLKKDGFFYDHFGIPHAVHEDTLYPIADKTYLLYFEGGKPKGPGRKISASHRDLYRASFGLIKRIMDDKLNPDAIRIVAYEEIAKANKAGEHHLYPWQREMFRQAVSIADRNPLRVLTPSRYRLTGFESTYASSTTLADKRIFQPGDVLAQYEALDLRYSELQRVAETYDPESVPLVLKSRKKLHQAAQTLLKSFIEELGALDPGARENLRLQPAFRVFEAYWRKSKLSFEIFEEGLRTLGDDVVYMLRADNVTAKYIGFVSQDKWVEVINSLPYSQQVAEFVRELKTYLGDYKNREEIEKKVAEWQKSVDEYPRLLSLLPDFLQAKAKDLKKTQSELSGTVLDKLVERIFKSRFSARGTSVQFQRSLIDFIEHANGSKPQKVGTSFTTSMGLLVPTSDRADGGLKFTSSVIPAWLYLAKMKKTEVDWNMAMLSNEYEMILKSPIGPWRIEDQFPGAELGKKVEGLSEASIEFLGKYKMGILPPKKATPIVQYGLHDEIDSDF